MQGKPEKRPLERYSLKVQQATNVACLQTEGQASSPAQNDNRERQESPSILYQLDLGQHTLALLTDGSIDLLAHEEEPISRVFPGLRLDAEETYRLFISLHEQYRDRRQSWHHEY